MSAADPVQPVSWTRPWGAGLFRLALGIAAGVSGSVASAVAKVDFLGPLFVLGGLWVAGSGVDRLLWPPDAQHPTRLARAALTAAATVLAFVLCAVVLGAVLWLTLRK